MKKHNRLFLSGFILLGLAYYSTIVQAAIPQPERDALLALYTATGGDQWHHNTGWTGAVGTECSWYGVVCDTEQTTITGLTLQANNLRGPLPEQLKSLQLTSGVDLSYNAVYSPDQILIEHLDAGNPAGTLLSTQTLDAVNVTVGRVSETAFDVSWQQASYTEAGGYRLYLARQIENGTATPYLSEFTQVADIAGKDKIFFTIEGLTPCTQYFVKVSSYTDSPAIESDGKQFTIHGTIPNWNAGCDLTVFSTGNITFISSYNNEITEGKIDIELDQSGNLTYSITYPGEAPPVINPNICTITGDSVSLNGQATLNDVPSTCDGNGAIDITTPGVGSPQKFPGMDNIGFEVQNFDVAESAEKGAVVNKLSGYFLESSEVRYSIVSGNVGDVFAIDSINKEGVITVTGVLNTTQQSKYLLEVKIENNLAETVTVPIQISVLADTKNYSPPEQPADSQAAGCTLHTGAPFDPLLPLLLLAGIYHISRPSRRH